jgi:hypothetical protein
MSWMVPMGTSASAESCGCVQPRLFRRAATSLPMSFRRAFLWAFRTASVILSP